MKCGVVIVILPAVNGHVIHFNQSTDHVEDGGATSNNLHPQTGSQLTDRQKTGDTTFFKKWHLTCLVYRLDKIREKLT